MKKTRFLLVCCLILMLTAFMCFVSCNMGNDHNDTSDAPDTNATEGATKETTAEVTDSPTQTGEFTDDLTEPETTSTSDTEAPTEPATPDTTESATPDTVAPTEPDTTATPDTEAPTEPDTTATPDTDAPTEPDTTATPDSDAPTEPDTTEAPDTEAPTEPDTTATPDTEAPTEPDTTTTPDTEAPTEPDTTEAPDTEAPTEPDTTEAPDTEAPTEPETTIPSETEAPTETQPTVHEHNWKDATCELPKTCSTCGETEGEPAGHSGGEARCMKKAKCDVCGKEYGSRGSHKYEDKITTDEYLKTPATMNSKAVYYYACLYCGKKSMTSTYQWGNTLLGEKADKYKAEDGDVEKFLFFTDPHYITDEENGTWRAGTLDMLSKMGEYYNTFSPSFAISGGDWLNDSNSRENAIHVLKDIKQRLNTLFGKAYLTVGNHDYNYQTRLDVPNTTTHSRHELTLEERIDAWFSEYGKTYYTFSGENTKFYVFDTGKDWGHFENVNEFDQEQIIWFLESLAANDDKHIAMVAHIVYLNETVVHPATLKYTEISAAYNAREIYEYNGKSYDFSDKTGKVEFLIGGHEHYDKSGYINGIAYVMTAAARGSSNGIPFFDLFMVDYDERVIDITCIAGSSDRKVYLDQEDGGSDGEETSAQTPDDTTETTSPTGEETDVTEPSVPTLEYEFDSQSNSYYVKGMGDMTGDTVIIPDTYLGKPITAILDGAFANAGISNINIGKNITRIGARAFYGSEGIEIYYIGTKKEWIAIEKDAAWREGMTKYTIYTAPDSQNDWEIPIG